MGVPPEGHAWCILGSPEGHNAPLGPCQDPRSPVGRTSGSTLGTLNTKCMTAVLDSERKLERGTETHSLMPNGHYSECRVWRMRCTVAPYLRRISFYVRLARFTLSLLLISLRRKCVRRGVALRGEARRGSLGGLHAF